MQEFRNEESSASGRNREGKSFKPGIGFPPAVRHGKTLVFKGATGLHLIEVPFTPKGIKIP
jgi:hypothetical protein